MKTVENYAMQILSENGCDCYTYGGEYAKHVLEDLKEGYPDGMEFPYVDVANAILTISRPTPITRSPYHVTWETDNCCDGFDCESFESAKCAALDTLIEWEMEESQDWSFDPETYKSQPTEEQKENWDYMIYNCGVSVYKYNPQTDEYDEVWSPSEEELDSIGWKLFYE